MICIADKKRGLLLRIRSVDYYWGYDWGLVRQYSTLFLSTMLSYGGEWGNKKNPLDISKGELIGQRLSIIV